MRQLSKELKKLESIQHLEDARQCVEEVIESGELDEQTQLNIRTQLMEADRAPDPKSTRQAIFDLHHELSSMSDFNRRLAYLEALTRGDMVGPAGMKQVKVLMGQMKRVFQVFNRLLDQFDQE